MNEPTDTDAAPGGLAFPSHAPLRGIQTLLGAAATCISRDDPEGAMRLIRQASRAVYELTEACERAGGFASLPPRIAVEVLDVKVRALLDGNDPNRNRLKL